MEVPAITATSPISKVDLLWPGSRVWSWRAENSAEMEAASLIPCAGTVFTVRWPFSSASGSRKPHLRNTSPVLLRRGGRGE